MGDLYLNIVESKNRDAGGFDRQSVILFSEDLQEFLKGFDESLKALEKAVREKRRSGTDHPSGARREGPASESNRRREIKPGSGEARSGGKDAWRDDKFRRREKGEDRSEERGRKTERDRGIRKGERGEKSRPSDDRKNTKDRWGERAEKKRFEPGNERNSRGRSGERETRRRSSGSDTGKKGTKRVVVRKRDRDN